MESVEREMAWGSTLSHGRLAGQNQIRKLGTERLKKTERTNLSEWAKYVKILVHLNAHLRHPQGRRLSIIRWTRGSILWMWGSPFPHRLIPAQWVQSLLMHKVAIFAWMKAMPILNSIVLSSSRLIWLLPILSIQYAICRDQCWVAPVPGEPASCQVVGWLY